MVTNACAVLRLAPVFTLLPVFWQVVAYCTYIGEERNEAYNNDKGSTVFRKGTTALVWRELEGDSCLTLALLIQNLRGKKF